MYCIPIHSYVHTYILYPCISPTIQQGKFHELKYSRISHQIFFGQPKLPRDNLEQHSGCPVGNLKNSLKFCPVLFINWYSFANYGIRNLWVCNRSSISSCLNERKTNYSTENRSTPVLLIPKVERLHVTYVQMYVSVYICLPAHCQ